MKSIPWLLLLCLSLLGSTECGITSQWDECGCRWDEWEAWSTCNSECNGRRSRTRKVWLYKDKSGCYFAFSTCATSDMGSDYSSCNTFCHNGGTSNSYSCSCVTGFYGACCGFQVNCGNPGSISNGNLNGGTFTYGSTVTYTCYSGYLLVDGTSSRKCELNAIWSGTNPRCAYYNSCSSGPCKNRATCTNIPDDYQCACTHGWSGKNCDENSDDDDDELNIDDIVDANDDAENKAFLDELEKMYEEPKKFGDSIDNQMAKLVDQAINKPMKTETLTKLEEQYLVPENCKRLQVPKVNKEIWRGFKSKKQRDPDLALQKCAKMHDNYSSNGS
ncbi:Hypothetical predicted protein [Mytilus galloprovincialis]|uniref:Uncharacterized protein n=1 Tax=Mytilus galloprovincialis TaxID=29158 RepID=A0A8B6CR89_MYTGA|nr:Hypothetical predicted protein [Mytilus galloprovincialis]